MLGPVSAIPSEQFPFKDTPFDFLTMASTPIAAGADSPSENTGSNILPLSLTQGVLGINKTFSECEWSNQLLHDCFETLASKIL